MNRNLTTHCQRTTSRTVGEDRFTNNVGPETLRPTKAWETHPIKLLAER